MKLQNFLSLSVGHHASFHTNHLLVRCLHTLQHRPPAIFAIVSIPSWFPVSPGEMPPVLCVCLLHLPTCPRRDLSPAFAQVATENSNPPPFTATLLQAGPWPRTYAPTATPNQVMVEGYITGRLIVDVLRGIPVWPCVWVQGSPCLCPRARNACMRACVRACVELIGVAKGKYIL